MTRRRRIEPNVRHVRQQRCRLIEQPRGDAPAARGRIHQHHADPGEAPGVAERGDGADDTPSRPRFSAAC
jgi:hypothetical protein